MYSSIKSDITNIYDELFTYFVPGGECILKDTIDRERGLTKAQVGKFVTVGWKNWDIAWDDLKPGKIYEVEQPDYMIILVKDHLIALTPERTELEKKHVKIVFQQFLCESALAQTMHSVQGSTRPSIIVSINAHKGQG